MTRGLDEELARAWPRLLAGLTREFGSVELAEDSLQDAWVRMAGREDVLDPCPRARSDDECHTLVTVEPGHGRQRPTLDLHDRDSEAGRVKDDAFQSLSTVRDDQESQRGPTGDERLFNGPTAGDEFKVSRSRGTS